jgi:hypothetical protein
MYFQLYVYAAQFESLLARWPEERFDLLQPDTPSVHFILIFLSVEQVKDVAAKKEAWSSHRVEMFSGSRVVVGGVNFMKGGAAAPESTKAAEA